MNARKVQKEATRERVVTAARELFDSVGFEATTVRAIAARAGVSVGSVFTTFTSKGEILSHIMQERLDLLYAELDRVAPNLRGSTADRLRSIAALHFTSEATHARLLLAHISAAYDWTLPETIRPYGRAPRLREILRGLLRDGQARGDVDPQIDLDPIVDLLLAAYAWTYRLVAWERADAARMSAVMDVQIGLIARGFAPPDGAAEAG